MPRRLAAFILVLAVLALSGLTTVTTQAAPPPAGVRGEDYANTTTITDVAIPMSDGVKLRGDLILPADANGEAVARDFPVLLTITAYNKTVIGSPAGAAIGGTDQRFFVKRGYAQLIVDARGTGTSEGEWGAFSERENQDSGEVVEWAAGQDWSNGSVGMYGPSYMGINQIFAAAEQPEGLKAIFPQVPAADVYRDVVASGGAVDVGFIPLWLGLVTATGLIPPAYAGDDPEGAFKDVLGSLTGLTNFTAPLMLDALAGGKAAFDGPFYETKSPINVVDQVEVPTFLIGGHYDLFQRGTPLLYERLRANGVPTKFILGPWNHLEGSSGAEVGDAGYGSLPALQLAWFDQYVMERPQPQLNEVAPLTYYEINSGDWVQATDWIGDDLSAKNFKLSGRATIGGNSADLTTGKVRAGRSAVLPVPTAGVCSRSSTQWTAGVPGLLGLDKLCSNNALNDAQGLAYESKPMQSDLHIRGPLNAKLFVSSPVGDSMLAVDVSTVAPDGTSNRLTGGWQMISHRALDRDKTRYLDGEVLQAYHPHTKAAKQRLRGGEIAPVDVEIFPTGAVIPEGHTLRISVHSFDFPHLLPTVPDLLSVLFPVTLHNSAKHPSRLTLAAAGG